MAYTTINKPTDYFNTVLYTGNDTDDHAITGVNFQPDFVWIKGRSSAVSHNLYDVIRGANKPLRSNGTNAEFTRTDALKSFDSDGFTLDDDATSDEVNNNGVTYASWNWLAGGTASSNTDGSITSSVSANTTSGFSIVSYTSNGSASQTVGHGLGVAPNVIISKNRTDGGATYGNWVVYHSSLATANDKKLTLNSTAAASSTNEWGDTDPTSTVYSVHTSGDGATNHSTDQIVSYCFVEKKGFSKFGSYKGNGNTDGTFVYTGFKPAFILVKDTGSTNGWYMFDNKRSSYNGEGARLEANSNSAELTNNNFDILSNGFKNRLSGTGSNGSGNNYIYMAFAENPLVTSGGTPATAR